MARIVKAHDVRKNEILDTAYELIYRVGYEQATVEAIIEETGIAKGTFYHYFKSKLDLLDSLVERMTDRIVEKSRTVIESKENALRKFRDLFEIGGAVKLEHREMLVPALKYLFSDENLIARHWTMKKAIEKLAPVYAAIIRQGVTEGVFDTPYPDDVVELILGMGYTFGELTAKLIFELDKRPENIKILERKLRMYEHTMERILGAEEGSLKLYDWRMIERFVTDMETAKEEDDDNSR
ncbi:MAG: TetR/AcrR family transcriptional regulator [Spirochaetes bacterium]|nr:TetR/AcrR family transcriptional regulator [Spirochaetota bacterium]